MGDAERLWYYIIVATAGHDTTSFALAGRAWRRCSATPTSSRRSRDDPDARRATPPTSSSGGPRRCATSCATPTDSRRRSGGVVDPRRRPGAAVVPVGQPRRGRVRRPHALRRHAAPTPTSCSRSASAPTSASAPSSPGARSARSSAKLLAQRRVDIEPAGAGRSGPSRHFVSGVKHLPIRYRFRELTAPPRAGSSGSRRPIADHPGRGRVRGGEQLGVVGLHHAAQTVAPPTWQGGASRGAG